MYIPYTYRMFFSMNFAEMLKILLQNAMYKYTSTYCTVHFPKFHSSSKPSESLISLWQQNENGAAAQPLIGIKRHTHVQNCGCDKHVKQATSVLPSGQRAGGLKTKDRQFQYQHDDFGCCFFFPWVLLTYPRGKIRVLPWKLVYICKKSTDQRSSSARKLY